jgi:tetratricopeptide (TPR) repeat protein
MDANFAVAHYELGQVFEQKGMHAEAIAELKEAIELSGASATFSSHLAYAFAVSGRRDEAIEIVKTLEGLPGQPSSIDSGIALIYVGLGDNDQAMVWLDKAYQARFNPSILLRPAFDPLRADARFQDLVRRIGLPQLALQVGKTAF